jgi:hypothetical protein
MSALLSRSISLVEAKVSAFFFPLLANISKKNAKVGNILQGGPYGAYTSVILV